MFTQVLAQYSRAITQQVKRRDRQHRDFFTKDEQKANTFYFDSRAKVGALDEAEPTGEGFVMRTADELAPVRLGFGAPVVKQ